MKSGVNFLAGGHCAAGTSFRHRATSTRGTQASPDGGPLRFPMWVTAPAQLPGGGRGQGGGTADGPGLAATRALKSLLYYSATPDVAGGCRRRHSQESPAFGLSPQCKRFRSLCRGRCKNLCFASRRMLNSASGHPAVQRFPSGCASGSAAEAGRG